MGGDFKARSPFWGSLTSNSRGEAVVDWAAELGLHIGNVGMEPTCIRHNGASIVDLTWVSAAVRGRVREWRVLSSIETLSDHAYVAMSIAEPNTSRPVGRFKMSVRYGWSIKRLDQQALPRRRQCGQGGPDRAGTRSQRRSGWVERYGDCATRRCPGHGGEGTREERAHTGGPR